MDGISFVNNIAKLAEAHNHHPDLKIGYCKVTVSISSHYLGGVSTKCVNLALDIDRVLENS
jgi:4a-hydroxytetrahydrobiopterin dehydratase